MAHGPKKLKAFKLRKQKKSYREIAEQLEISKSTVSYWFKDIDWSNDIKKQLDERNRRISLKRLENLIKLRKIKYQKLYIEAENEAIKEFSKLKKDYLFISGIYIYWTEGDRNSIRGPLKVSNTDPRMLRIFKNFLIQICRVDINKIKSHTVIYPDLEENKCVNYWSKNIGIKKKNIYKSTVIQGRHKVRRLPYGIGSVSVSNKYLKKKVLKWIDLLAEYHIGRE